MSDSAPTDTLRSTRRALHQAAEHVLSAALKRATGQFSLRPGPGGLRTPPLPDGRVLALIEGDIAVIDAEGVRRAPLTTVRTAADFAGTEPGFPWTKHPPGTVYVPDALLDLDVGAARLLADWFTLGDLALRALAATLSPGEELTPQVFPEHLDLAITMAEVNYGVSPGDDVIPAPYLYVGPFGGRPTGNEAFWNASFGAFTTIDDVPTAADALVFFLEGHHRLARP